MIYFENENHNPYFNQALEEILFTNASDEDLEQGILLLWINDPAVIVGRFQNVFEEVNLPLAQKKNVPVIRRMSGGGTVYHDRGNLNYTLITKYSGELDYDCFVGKAIKSLNSIGVSACKGTSAEIRIGGDKISGSAQMIKKNKILHHGTLLFCADMESLHGLLSPVPGKISSKAIASVRSSVTNISGHCGIKTIEDFKEKFAAAMTEGKMLKRILPAEIIKKAENLAKEKYAKDSWNINESPKFEYVSEDGKVQFKAVKGIITECNNKDLEGLEAKEIIIKAGRA